MFGEHGAEGPVGVFDGERACNREKEYVFEQLVRERLDVAAVFTAIRASPDLRRSLASRVQAIGRVIAPDAVRARPPNAVQASR